MFWRGELTMRAFPGFRTFTLLSCAAGIAFAPVAIAAPAPVGIAAAVVGDVRIRSGGSAFAPAKLRQRVVTADQVRTGGDSRMQILLLDKTKFSIGANAQLTIDKFVYDPAGGTLAASIGKGAFRFMSGGSNRAKAASVHTPAATIGIRGTIFDGAVGELAMAIAAGERAVRRDVRSDPATATLIVLRGPGARTQGRVNVGAVDVTGASQTVTLDRPMLAAYVPYAGAEPIGPFEISTSGLVRLNDFILPPVQPMTMDRAPQPVPDRDRDRGMAPPFYGDGYPGGPYPGDGNRGTGYPGASVPGGTFVPGLGGLPQQGGNRPAPRATPDRPSQAPLGSASTPPQDTAPNPAYGSPQTSPSPSTGPSTGQQNQPEPPLQDRTRPPPSTTDNPRPEPKV